MSAKSLAIPAILLGNVMQNHGGGPKCDGIRGGDIRQADLGLHDTAAL
ncbi:hypothetical protein V462_09640 [Pantoea ananatis 15320]|nr:hypothetical protein [Pantoea ananatis]PKC31407.1 hypothetical protein V462_18650 [Pantoea ananatis 15320]PKC36654.1 hypothetical protein V462_09640 [Pantoea ananatis 15320]PKC43302.1 hypothetical protein V461_12785 [Pantoea ananatis BRT98]